MTDPMELVGRATEASDLRDRIMSPNVAKSEAEWWASREIERLEACIREMVEWRPIETFELSGQAHPVIVAVPDRDGGWLVGEAWLRAEEGDTLWENGWWWAGTSPGEYHDSPIIEMNYGPPKWWKPLPLPPSPGAEA